MAVSLASHDEQLRQVIETHDGAVFKHTGDGCCAVFDAPAAALTAAVATRVALSAAGSGPAAALRVRMALHTGAAQARGDDYFGPTRVLLARLSASPGALRSTRWGRWGRTRSPPRLRGPRPRGPVGWCWVNFGWLVVKTGDHSRADAAFTQALEIGRLVRSDDLIAHALAALGRTPPPGEKPYGR